MCAISTMSLAPTRSAISLNFAKSIKRGYALAPAMIRALLFPGERLYLIVVDPMSLFVDPVGDDAEPFAR